MCKWNGIGRHWIIVGLPQYVSLQRNLKSGAEIQNASCTRSGFLIRLKFVECTIVEDDDVLIMFVVVVVGCFWFSATCLNIQHLSCQHKVRDLQVNCHC